MRIWFGRCDHRGKDVYGAVGLDFSNKSLRDERLSRTRLHLLDDVRGYLVSDNVVA